MAVGITFYNPDENQTKMFRDKDMKDVNAKVNLVLFRTINLFHNCHEEQDI